MQMNSSQCPVLRHLDSSTVASCSMPPWWLRNRFSASQSSLVAKIFWHHLAPLRQTETPNISLFSFATTILPVKRMLLFCLQIAIQRSMREIFPPKKVFRSLTRQFPLARPIFVQLRMRSWRSYFLASREMDMCSWWPWVSHGREGHELLGLDWSSGKFKKVQRSQGHLSTG